MDAKYGVLKIKKICVRLQLRFLKMVLGLKTSTPSCMVFGETGSYPVEIEINCRLLSFWYNLMLNSVHVYSNKISNLSFKLAFLQYENSPFQLSWLQHVHSLLNHLGLSFLWSSPVYSMSQFKGIVKQRLRDQYIQNWKSELEDNGVCCNYKLFKKDFTFEKYLVSLPYSLRQPFLKFRLCNHKLPIQQSRLQNIARAERLCNICDVNEVGDEFHYLFNCSCNTLKETRLLYLQKYYLHHANVIKFFSIMNEQHTSKLVKLAKFIRVIMKLFSCVL